MEPQEVKTTPPWMGCQSNARLPPAFHQASLTVSQYPFILLEGEGQYPFRLLGKEKHCESKVSCQGTQHIDPARSGNQAS